MQKAPSNKLVMPQSYSVESEVMVHDHRHTDKWVPSTIVPKLGPLTYKGDTGNGNIVKCHVNELTQCLAPQSVGSETEETPSIEDNFQYMYPEIPEPQSVGSETKESSNIEYDFEYLEITEPPSQEPVIDHPSPSCYPLRVRTPPD